MVIIIFCSLEGQPTSLYSVASRLALRGPPSLLPNGYLGPLSPRVKRPVRETDDSTPSGADGNGIISPPTLYVFTVRCLTKRRDNFSFHTEVNLFSINVCFMV
jgi:hypothetical protein